MPDVRTEKMRGTLLDDMRRQVAEEEAMRIAESGRQAFRKSLDEAEQQRQKGANDGSSGNRNSEQAGRCEERAHQEAGGGDGG